jgi:hypothetical protein
MKLLESLIGRSNSPPLTNKQVTNYTIITLNKMKTIKTLFFATLLFTLTTNAQITKGNWMVGGSAYFNSYNAKNGKGEEIQKGTSVNLQPNIGYFFYNNFAGGLSAGYGISKTNNDASNSGFSVGPFLRYYFLKPEKRVNLLAEVDYYYGKNFDRRDFSTSYGLKAGPVIYFNSSVGLELLAKYDHNYYSSGADTTNNFQIGLGLQIHLEK